MGDKVRFAIIGCGGIARMMAKALNSIDNGTLYGVASRSAEKAEKFKSEFGAEKAYSSYEDAFSDKNVDAVYIATPHPFHAELSIKAMRAGKAVLCEKPAAMNKAELSEVLKVREECGAFFMEAMWMRFQPAFRRTMELVKNGTVGTLQNIYADICCKNEPFKGSRMYEKELGGGAALDLGIYMLSYALSAVSAASDKDFSECMPDEFHKIVRKTFTDVDGFESVIMRNGNIISTLTAAVDSGCGEETRTAKLVGTKGTIVARGFWYAGEISVFDTEGNLLASEKYPFSVNGYEYEATEVCDAIIKGLSECDVHRHKDSLLLAMLIDKIIE